MGVQIEDVFEVALHLGLVGFAVQHGQAAAIAGFGHFLEFPRTKSKNVGTEGFGGFEMQLFAPGFFGAVVQRAIAHGLPIGRNIEMQSVARFEIGLVKTRKNRGSPIGYHQGVQIIGAAIEGLVVGFKRNAYCVFAQFQLFSREYKMALRVIAF